MSDELFKMYQEYLKKTDQRKPVREVKIEFSNKYKLPSIKMENRSSPVKFIEINHNGQTYEVKNVQELRVILALEEVFKQKENTTVGLIGLTEQNKIDIPRQEIYQILEQLTKRNILEKKPAESLKNYFRYGFKEGQK